MPSDPETAPAVSVIVPAYNMGAFIAEAITSVVEGSFGDVEVIVVDDGSTDDTRAVVARFTDPGGDRFDPRVRYVYRENGGKPAAVNEGLKRARGAYVTVLDADDQLPPCSLATRFARAAGDVELVVGGFEVFDGAETFGARAVPAADTETLLRYYYRSLTTPFHFNACLVAHRLVDRVGPFDSRLKRCQDIDYAIRCLQRAESIAVVPAIVYRYRKHRGSVRERLRFRWKTALHRPRVFWKNFRGPRRVFMILFGFGLDVMKMVYELAGNYKR